MVILNDDVLNLTSCFHPDLTSYFIGHKILKYFNDFYDWHFQLHCKSEHKQKKWNKIKRDMSNADKFFLLYKVLRYLNDFWNLFFDKVYLMMNNNSFSEKISIVYFDSINVKGNRVYFAEKNSWPGAKITTIFRLTWKYFNSVMIKIIQKKLVLLWAAKSSFAI